jgi:hypothetical protein
MDHIDDGAGVAAAMVNILKYSTNQKIRQQRPFQE